MNLLTMSNEDYRKRPGVSASMLKSMARGWRTFEAEHITKTAPRKESAAMALGTAVHTALLEPERFEAEYVVCPAACSDRRTKAYKEWSATVDDREVITADDAATIEAIRKSVEADVVAKQLLDPTDGVVEKCCEWTECDVFCRMRFDKKVGPFCVDIKTCQDVTEEAFAKTIASYRYDLQAAHYLSGLTNNGIGWGMRFVFIAVETCVPYRVRCYEMCDGDFNKADAERVALLNQYRERMLSGDWSEPGEGELRTLYLPNWFANREVMV